MHSRCQDGLLVPLISIAGLFVSVRSQVMLTAPATPEPFTQYTTSQIGTLSSKIHRPLGLLLSHGASEGDATGLCPSYPFCPSIPVPCSNISFMSWLIGSDTACKSACLTIYFYCAHFSFCCSVCILASPKLGRFETEPI